MPVKHHVSIDRARRTARALAREGGITHQQALDRVAQEAGFRHWNAMVASDTAAPAPLPPTGPAMAAEPEPAEFGPTRLFFELDQFEYLRMPGSPEPAGTGGDSVSTTATPGDDAEVPTPRSPRRGLPGLVELMSRTMREASHAHPGSGREYGHRIRQLPLDARMVAEALDPEGAPHEDDEPTVRCPLHGDASPSLRIAGSGRSLRMACMAGCSASDLRDRLVARLAEESRAATAFMRANDRSKVVGGHGHGRPGTGGAGGTYDLADGSRHPLNVLSCRMLADGYPNWTVGHVPRSVAALERRLRIAIAGGFAITTQVPEDRARGLWRFVVAAGHDGDYRILVSMRQGEQAGINASHGGGFSIDASETFDSPAAAVARVLELTRTFETIDPVERAANEVQHAREVARNARLRGTVNGWGWWAGPDPDEMTFGGPYRTKAEAISSGNGSCMEDGEHFYVLQARTSEPDGEGRTEFQEIRGLKRCRSR